MKSRTFLVGFGLSAVLLGICAWYGFVSSASVLAAFDPTLSGRYVHQPKGYDVALLLFTCLNLPAVVAVWVMLRLLDLMGSPAAGVRASAALATAGIASAVWWKVLARWKGHRSAHRNTPKVG